jgi:hypothetical protein
MEAASGEEEDRGAAGGLDQEKKTMNCGISNSAWTDYLDGTLRARERAPIDAHVRVCASCRSEVDAWRQIERRLRIECGIAQQAMDLPVEAQKSAEKAILAAIGQAKELRETTGESKGSQERLWRVRWVLALLCGANTATRIIQAAEKHAGVSAQVKPSEQKWLVFLRRLAFITTEVCGCFAGELIWSIGK